MIEGFIFDLDGVLTDTARFHYQAWKTLADEAGIVFNWEINQKLRGVSRRNSLQIIFGDHGLTEEQIQKKMDRKNALYQAMLTRLTPAAILPGVVPLLAALTASGIKLGVGSASKNARTVLQALGLLSSFDVIGDGHCVTHSKPAPDLFIFVARQMGVNPGACVVVEDAAAGIQAAKRAGMRSVGLGEAVRLSGADVIYPSLSGITLSKILEDLATTR